MKTKALISFAVTVKLICVFVFAYTKSRFSHDAAHINFVELESPMLHAKFQDHRTYGSEEEDF